MNTPTEYAKIVLIPVPWEGTTRTNKGSAAAAEAVLRACNSLDRDSLDVHDIEQLKVTAIPFPEEMYTLHDSDIAEASLKVNEFVYGQTMACFRKNEIPIIIGGESSVSFSAIEAASKKVPVFDVFHVSGKQNLCNAFGGQTWSDRSVMFNVAARLSNVGNITQVGIKSFTKEEKQYCDSLENGKDDQLLDGLMDGIGKVNTQVTAFYNKNLRLEMFQGQSWYELCQRIVSNIRERVWVSIDLSAFNSAQRSSVKSVTPGGLEYDEVVFLLKLLAKSGKEILGFDIVGGSHDAKDVALATNLLFEMAGFAAASQGKAEWAQS